MTNTHVKGHLKEAEGKIKEVTGKLVGNERLEEKGKAEKLAGQDFIRRPAPISRTTSRNSRMHEW